MPASDGDDLLITAPDGTAIPAGGYTIRGALSRSDSALGVLSAGP